MGFGFKNPFKKLKNIFSKKSTWGAILGTAVGGPFGGIAGYSMGSSADAQEAATDEAKKARNQARDQYAAAEAAAKAEAERIANLEEERKRKLLLYGTSKPSTMVGGYLGLGGQANINKPSLG